MSQRALDNILFKVDPHEQRQRALTIDYLLEGYVQTARAYSNRVPEASARVLMAAGRIYDNSGRWKEALPPLIEGVGIWRTIRVAGASERLADGLNWLSWACAHHQPPIAEKALEAAKECFEIRKERFGMRNDDTLAAMADLSSMFRIQGDTNRANDMFLDVLAIARGLEGTTDDRTQVRSEITKIVSSLTFFPTSGQEDLEKFLWLFLDPNTKWLRLGRRLPWTLAQFGEYVHDNHSETAGIALVDYAIKEGKRMLGADDHDVGQCQRLREKLGRKRQ